MGPGNKRSIWAAQAPSLALDTPSPQINTLFPQAAFLFAANTPSRGDWFLETEYSNWVELTFGFRHSAAV